jgi:hypothetical protein
MAGLSKAVFVLLLVLGIAAIWTIAGAADGIQTDSIVLPPGDVQTGSNVLQPVFDLIDSNANANPIDQANLKAHFESAVTLGVLTPEQAIAMLDLVQWETLVEPEALANAAAAIQTILDDLIAEDPIGDPVAALQHLLNLLATPAGTLTAIGNAGASDKILAEVASLVASGVPPGILVRIIKQGLRGRLSPEESSAQLDMLATAVAEGGDVSWGQIANEATEKGNSKHPEQEQNETVEGSIATEMETSPRGNGTKDPDREKNDGKEKDRDSTHVERGHSSAQLDEVATATTEDEDAGIENSEEPEQEETGSVESGEEPEQEETGTFESTEEPEQQETEHGNGREEANSGNSRGKDKKKDK